MSNKEVEYMNDRILLTTKDILEKDFKIDTRGYRPQEVDKFLDIIIHDYEEYEAVISDMKKTQKEIIQMYQMLMF